MTGAEIVGGAVAAAKGVKAAADAMGGDADERQQLARLGEGLPAMSQAAQAKAHRVAIRQKFLTKCMAPLAAWVGHKIEYFDPETGQFASDLAEKMADVPEESIISPAPVVAVQAIEGLSFSLDEPNLKEMYLNLIAAASDGRRAEMAHPSFAQIIRQLSAREAGLLERAFDTMGRSGSIAVVELRRVDESISYRLVYRHLSNLLDGNGNPVEESNYPAFVDNWIRLGLVDVSYDTHITREGAYGWVKSRPEYKRLEANSGDVESRLEWQKGVLLPTDFGKLFFHAVTDTTEA